jgi:hypothetical protein
MVIAANEKIVFADDKGSGFWEITGIYSGNNAKLGRSFAKIRIVRIFALPMRLEISSERSPGRRGAVFRFEFRLCERERRGLIGLGWCREGAVGKMMV